ncbi:MAG: hypothetical protein KDC27_13750 [Acidobacteria bacterium]|nr:hypothetical protein [Acidobacteriota bacterium]
MAAAPFRLHAGEYDYRRIAGKRAQFMVTDEAGDLVTIVSDTADPLRGAPHALFRVLELLEKSAARGAREGGLV